MAAGIPLSTQDKTVISLAFPNPTVGLNVIEWLSRIDNLAYVDKIITSAEVLALYTTPVTVLPAVGSGVYPQFVAALVFLDYNSAVYVDAAGEDLVFQETTGGTHVSQTVDGSLFDYGADVLVWVGPTIVQESTDNVLVDNAGIGVTTLVGNWASGDSPLKIRLYYRLIRKATMEAIA